MPNGICVFGQQNVKNDLFLKLSMKAKYLRLSEQFLFYFPSFTCTTNVHFYDKIFLSSNTNTIHVISENIKNYTGDRDKHIAKFA